MGYPDAAWERAMTVQAVMLKAVSGEIHWFRAAEILGWSPRTLRRWRERYGGFNVRHFHEVVRREHGVTLSYSFVKQARQQRGLVTKRRARGRHRLRREPRETSQGVRRALATGSRAEGLPMALYTDRAGWAFYTPTATGRVAAPGPANPRFQQPWPIGGSLFSEPPPPKEDDRG